MAMIMNGIVSYHDDEDGFDEIMTMNMSVLMGSGMMVKLAELTTETPMTTTATAARTKKTRIVTMTNLMMIAVVTTMTMIVVMTNGMTTFCGDEHIHGHGHDHMVTWS